MRIFLFLILLVLSTAPITAQPRVGDRLPALPGASLTQLSGPKGLVLVVFRSADW